MTLLSIITILSLAIALGYLLLCVRFLRLSDDLDFSASGRLPKVTIVVPCRGYDYNLTRNIKAILGQAYPDFEVILAVGDIEDPAVTALSEALRESSHPARLVVATPSRFRSDVLNNQLAALNESSPETDVLVFLDSDGYAPPGFLCQLIRPLTLEFGGTTTGIRYLVPRRPSLTNLIASVWSVLSIPINANRKLGTLWGGAMAIQREVFWRLGVAELWKHSLTDDLTLHNALREAGLGHLLVPECVIFSEIDYTWREFTKFSIRQRKIYRIYKPWSWSVGLAVLLPIAVTPLLLLFEFAMYILGLSSSWRIFALLASCAATGASSAMLIQFVNSICRTYQVETGRSVSALQAFLITPWVMLLAYFHMILAANTGRVEWREIIYHIHTPTNIEVISPSKDHT